MTFDMYVYGSLDAYLGVLNAVAMVFNQGSFMTSVYLLGGLLMLVLTLALAGSYTAGPQQILKYAAVFAMLVSLGSIKSTLNVQDIYTGQLNRVDNVPMVLALPASISTTAFYGILNKTSTAYQGADASYVSISQGGFMDPLKELLAMRTGLTTSNPALADTLRNFVVNCWNNQRAGGDIESLLKSPTSLQYLLQNGALAPAWTVNFINATNKKDGDSVICGDAANKIWTEAQAYLYRDVGSSASLVSQVTTNMANIGPRLGGGKPTLTASDLNTSAASTLSKLAAVGQSTQDQMLNLLTFNLVGDTFGCIQGSGGSPMELTKCATLGTALTQGLEQWKADAAGNASFFQGIMIPASMFIQMLAIALFPLIFITAILAPGKSMQIMMGYLVLMVWSASWAPVAGAIQWVMQMVLNQDIANYKSGITYGNAMQFYNTLSKDLAIGADMMAATPLIAMAVLTGSFFAFTSLAGRWSSDRVNEKIAAPDLQSPGAVNSVGSRQTTDAGLGFSYTTNQAMPSLDMSSAISSSLASSRQKGFDTLENWGNTHGWGSKEARGWQKAIRESDSAKSDVQTSLANDKSLSESSRAQIQAAVGGGIDLPGVKAKIEASGMMAKDKANALKWAESNSESLSRAHEASKAENRAFDRFNENARSHGFSDAKSLRDSFQETSAFNAQVGSREPIQANQFGNFYRGAHDRTTFDNLMGVTEKEFMPGGRLYGRNREFGTGDGASTFGKLLAMQNSGIPELQQRAATMIASLAGMGGLDTSFNRYSNLSTPAHGASGMQSGGGGSLDNAGPPDSSWKPGQGNLSKVDSAVGKTSKTISDGKEKIERGFTGEMVDHMRGQTDSIVPRNTNPQSRGGG